MIKRIMATLCCIPLLLNIPLGTIHKLKGELQHKKLKNPSVEKDIITKTLIQMRKEKKLKLEQEEIKRIEELEKEKQRLLEMEVEKLEQREKEEKALQDRQLNSRSIQDNRNRSIQGRKVTLNVSHYCSCYECCQNTSNIGKTASGAYTKAGVTIAMPSNIPFGTRVQIGNNTYINQDRGGAIVNNGSVMHVDIYVDNHSEALRLGRYVTEGYILD